MFRVAGQFITWLWRFSGTARVSPIGEARIGSRLAGCLLFMVLLFVCIGLVLAAMGLAFGFGLEDVDAWLARQGSWLDFAGSVLIQKVLMAIILLVCIAIAASLLHARWRSGTPGAGALVLGLLGCLVVGYCSTVNMIAPLDPHGPSSGARQSAP